MTMIAFQPDHADSDATGPIETALFLGVRREPSLESTQLRWQVRVGAHHIVQLASGATYLETLGGALFITTKEPRPEPAADEAPDPIGWMRWIAEDGRRSFQIRFRQGVSPGGTGAVPRRDCDIQRGGNRAGAESRRQ
jgi:hypothetical protein